jgi:hypothetical protein
MKLILSFVVSSTCLLGTFLISDNQLPGALMSIEDQQAVHGMACGENPSTTGQSLCSVPAFACAEVPGPVGTVGNACAVPGANCAACTGTDWNITCQGTYDPAGTHLCFLTTPACCASVTCMDHGMFWVSCGCDGPAGAPSGMRMLATVTYNVPSGCP